MEIIAAIGSLMLAVCGLPQAIKSWRMGSAEGVSLVMLMLWLVGEILLGIYVSLIGQFVMLINYLSNVIIVLVILRYRLLPRATS